MTRSPDAPTGATEPAHVPSTDRATETSSQPDEGPAPQVAGAPTEPARAAAPLEPPGSPPSPSFASAFSFGNASDARAWLTAVRGDVDDLAALAREGAHRPRHRVLSRGEIRRRTRDAKRALHALLAQAEAGLPRLRND
jgi:hypothetical protein